MRDRENAQRRVDQIRAFRAEIEALKAAGALPLSADQEAAIAAYHDGLLRRLVADYDIDRSDAAGRLSRGMRLASFFGAVALTAAVYSLVSRFWGRLDLPLQAALLAVFPILALGGVEFAARRERTLYVASLFALVAYGTFWLAVGVLSWTLNIPFTPPYLWAGVIFGLALAVPYGFRLILAFALAALALAVAASMFQAARIEWTQAIERPELLVIAAFSLLLLVPPLARVEHGFAPVTRLVSLAIGLGGLLVLSVAGQTSLLPVSGDTAEGTYQVVMLAACLGALFIAVRRLWSETIILVAVMFALFLLTRFVDWFWDVLPRYVFFLILAAMAFVWIFVLRRMRGRLSEAQT
jgi:hypothetical protein